MFLNWYLSNEKNIFADDSMVKTTILFSSHFMGSSSLRLSEVLCQLAYVIIGSFHLHIMVRLETTPLAVIIKPYL